MASAVASAASTVVATAMATAAVWTAVDMNSQRHLMTTLVDWLRSVFQPPDCPFMQRAMEVTLAFMEGDTVGGDRLARPSQAWASRRRRCWCGPWLRRNNGWTLACLYLTPCRVTQNPSIGGSRWVCLWEAPWAGAVQATEVESVFRLVASTRLHRTLLFLPWHRVVCGHVQVIIPRCSDAVKAKVFGFIEGDVFRGSRRMPLECLVAALTEEHVAAIDLPLLPSKALSRGLAAARPPPLVSGSSAGSLRSESSGTSPSVASVGSSAGVGGRAPSFSGGSGGDGGSVVSASAASPVVIPVARAATKVRTAPRSR